MRKFLSCTILAIAAMAPAAVTLAAGHGGGPGMHAGGATHNAAGANSNGMKSADRDKGLDRAADRRNRHSVIRKHSKKAHTKK